MGCCGRGSPASQSLPTNPSPPPPQLKALQAGVSLAAPHGRDAAPVGWRYPGSPELASLPAAVFEVMLRVLPGSRASAQISRLILERAAKRGHLQSDSNISGPSQAGAVVKRKGVFVGMGDP